VVFAHCAFFANHADMQGGAFLVRAGASNAMLLDDCVLAGNSADGDGGAWWSYPTSGSSGQLPLTISNSTLVGNLAARGGAVFARGGCDARFYNSILWSNQAPVGAQVALDMAPSAVQFKLEYCDVEGGQAAVAVLSGNLNWAGGNVAVDPQFVDPLGPDLDAATVLDNDYRLGDTSPCVDAGRVGVMQVDLADIDHDGDVDEKVPLDFDLLPRRTDNPLVADTGLGNAPLVDLGCFEWQP
jgi:hypothetical protein